MKFKINKDILNRKYCAKLLLGTFLIGGSMLLYNNDLNAVIRGYYQITPDNYYCATNDNTKIPFENESTVCKFKHWSTHVNDPGSMASNMGNIRWTNYRLQWSMDKGANYKTMHGPETYNISFPSDLWEQFNYKFSTDTIVKQTGEVSVPTAATTASINPTKTTTFKMRKKMDINPVCWVEPVPVGGSGLTRLEGTNWFVYTSGDRRVGFVLDGTDYAPNSDGSSKSGDSYEEKGGSRLSYDYNDWGGFGAALNQYTMSMPLEGFPKNKETNQPSHNVFGELEYCKLRKGYYVDGDTPKCGTSQSPTGWTNGSVKVSKTCSDGGSGCVAPTESKTVTTNQTVTFTCKDKAGNVGASEERTVTNIDKLKPVCGSVTAKNANFYYNTAYQVNVPCTDQDKTSSYGKSGCKKSTYTASTDVSGNYSVKIYDNAGNETTCSGNKNLTDTSKPTVTIKLETGQEGYNSNTHFTSNSTVKATISATDSGKAGINKVCYKLSGATSKGETCVAASSTTITISNAGNTTITAYAYDNAYDYNGGSPKWNGNKSNDATKTVYIDRTAPVVNFTTTVSKEWSNVPPTATFTASDSQAGLYTVRSAWAPTTNSTEAFNNYSDTIKNHSASGNAFSHTAPKDTDISGEVYFHVEVCDNAYALYNNHQPNCTNSRLGPFKYDIINPPVPEPPGIDENDDGTPDSEAGSVDWTHVLKNLVFTGKNTNVSVPESGVAKINLYFDNNNPHTNTNINKATFNGQPDLVKVCSTDKTSNKPTVCRYSINFASLKSDPVQSGEGGPATEGVRFIKVEVYDLAGNKSSKVYGPFKWDTTKSKFTSNVTVSGTDGKFYHE